MYRLILSQIVSEYRHLQNKQLQCINYLYSISHNIYWQCHQLKWIQFNCLLQILTIEFLDMATIWISCATDTFCHERDRFWILNNFACVQIRYFNHKVFELCFLQNRLFVSQQINNIFIILSMSVLDSSLLWFNTLVYCISKWFVCSSK